MKDALETMNKMEGGEREEKKEKKKYKAALLLVEAPCCKPGGHRLDSL
jgi:hypothetical protein